MTTRMRLWLAPSMLLLMTGNLLAQHPTARDAFWSSTDLISVTPNPAAHKRAPSKPVTQHAGNSQSLPAAGQKNVVSGGKSSAGEQQNGQMVDAVQLVSENGYGAAPRLVSTASHRLGLRCSLLLRGLDNRYIEVPSNSVFHSGDHIRLSLLANEPGYIYVIQQGSTDTWSPVFPPPGSPPDANKIAAGQIQMVPGGTRAFAFDKSPGVEKLYVILSRAPVADIDRAIRGLQSNSHPAPPANPDSANEVLIAADSIPNLFVRQLASRDLTLVDEQTVNDSSGNANGGEQATYVVSKASAPDSSSEVVLKLDLRHE
jgi:Domain of unknown function (DUF4384)